MEIFGLANKMLNGGRLVTFEELSDFQKAIKKEQVIFYVDLSHPEQFDEQARMLKKILNLMYPKDTDSLSIINMFEDCYHSTERILLITNHATKDGCWDARSIRMGTFENRDILKSFFTLNDCDTFHFDKNEVRDLYFIRIEDIIFKDNQEEIINFLQKYAYDTN